MTKPGDRGGVLKALTVHLAPEQTDTPGRD